MPGLEIRERPILQVVRFERLAAFAGVRFPDQTSAERMRSDHG